MIDLEYFYDPTKRGLIYAKPGNRDTARSHEEVAKDNVEGGYESGLVRKTPMCPSRAMGLIDA